jgi:hypothetical protein
MVRMPTAMPILGGGRNRNPRHDAHPHSSPPPPTAAPATAPV